jgi:hypothetical protein
MRILSNVLLMISEGFGRVSRGVFQGSVSAFVRRNRGKLHKTSIRVTSLQLSIELPVYLIRSRRADHHTVFRNFSKYFVNTGGRDKTVGHADHTVVPLFPSVPPRKCRNKTGPLPFTTIRTQSVTVIPFTLWLHVASAVGKDCLNQLRINPPYLGLPHRLTPDLNDNLHHKNPVSNAQGENSAKPRKRFKQRTPLFYSSIRVEAVRN